MCLTARAGLAQKNLVAHGGRWTVRDGAVWVDGGRGPKLVATGTDFADGQAGVEVYFDSARGGNAGLIVRVSEAGTGADKFIGYEIALDPEHGVLRLGRHRHNFSLMRDIKVAVPLKRWIPLVVRIAGDRIEVDVAGRKVASERDTRGALPAGAVGLRPWQRSAGFRNLWVAGKGQKKRTIELRQDRIAAGKAPGPAPKPKPKPKRLPDKAAAALKARLVKAAGQLVFVKRNHFKRPFGIGSIIGWNIYVPGGGIYTCDLTKPGQPETELFRNDDGIVFDISLSFDAKKLLFSWRNCKKGDPFHIYEIGTDGRGLRQITTGRFHDVHPFYLPGGRIGFVSTRVEAHTLCQPGAACALYVMDADGKNMQRIHFGTLADHSPYVMDDGSILFTRWEYQDKSLTFPQGLWTLNPDGTRLQLYYGNTIYEPAVTWQAREIPGTSNILCTLAPHHGNPVGALGIIDRTKGLENPKAIRNITPEIPYRPELDRAGVGDRQFAWSYRDPYPLEKDLFLASYGGQHTSGPRRFRIFALDPQGHKALVHEDAKLSCFNPVPLVPRPTPHRKPLLPPSDQTTGTFFLTNVYKGLTGVKPGQVKAIRIMRVYAKRCNMRGSRAYDMDPLQSRATYYAKQCVGTVPVDANGSACFKAPAGVELYFQALDADGKELQRMGTITQIMPGETQSCLGCHENAFMAPSSGPAPAKLPHPKPVDITPPPWGDGPMDFATQVQPVFDKYCAKCHSGPDPKKGLDLSGDKTRFFNMAYDGLLNRGMVDYRWLLRTSPKNWKPLTTGSRVSKLMPFLEKKHVEAVIDDQSRRRIYTWIDANVPYYGTFEHTRPGRPGSRDAAMGEPWFNEFNAIYKAKCAPCHGGNFYSGNSGYHHTWINLTNPRFSRVLTATLAKSAKGLQLCKPKGNRKPPALTETDPTWQGMLKAIEKGQKALAANPRMDMPGAKPKPYPVDFGKLFTGFAGP